MHKHIQTALTTAVFAYASYKAGQGLKTMATDLFETVIELND